MNILVVVIFTHLMCTSFCRPRNSTQMFNITSNFTKDNSLYYIFYYSQNMLNNTKNGRFELPFTLFAYKDINDEMYLQKYIDVGLYTNTNVTYYSPVRDGMIEIVFVNIDNKIGQKATSSNSNNKYIGLKFHEANVITMYTHNDPKILVSTEDIGHILFYVGTNKDNLYRNYKSYTDGEFKITPYGLINITSITNGIQPAEYLAIFMISLGIIISLYGCYISVKDCMVPSKPYPSVSGRILMEQTDMDDLL